MDAVEQARSDGVFDGLGAALENKKKSRTRWTLKGKNNNFAMLRKNEEEVWCRQTPAEQLASIEC